MKNIRPGIIFLYQFLFLSLLTSCVSTKVDAPKKPQLENGRLPSVEEIDIIIAKGAEISEKIFSERRAGIHLVDLYIGGPTTITAVIKPAGLLMPLEPVLLLPEVVDPKAWWKGELDWIDKEHMVLAFQAYPTASLALNINMVKPEEIKSYRDLLNRALQNMKIPPE